jgi:protection of telomeres protein 1
MSTPAAGDVLVICSAKVRVYRDKTLLITNLSTSFHTYSASAIPRPPQSAKNALKSSYGVKQPGDKEHEYVSMLYHYTNKDSVPDDTTFQKQADQSNRSRDKFCRLENVTDGKFCDVIVNVVKAPFDEAEKTTIWVSDYTENDGFYKFSWDGKQQLGNQHRNPFGYLGDSVPVAAQWAGPFGQRSMQVTCYEPHAAQISSEVQLGQWIRIRNLRIKFGNNGHNLEGVLHEDRDFNRRQFDILKCEQDCDPRLKEAIRRKKVYEKLKKQQLKSFAQNENGYDRGSKRKADESEVTRLNSKTRRNGRREAERKKVEEQGKQAEERLGLNNLG